MDDWMDGMIMGSDVQFEHLLEDVEQFDVLLAALEGSDGYCEGIVVIDGVEVVINQEHLLFDSGGLLKVLQVLQRLPVHLSARLPVETLLNDLLNVDYVQHCIRVTFLTRSVNIHSKDLPNCSKELFCKGSWLDVHIIAFELHELDSTCVRM